VKGRTINWLTVNFPCQARIPVGALVVLATGRDHVGAHGTMTTHNELGQSLASLEAGGEAVLNEWDIMSAVARSQC
jgi:hypothetical protein